jgi:DNA-binding GntR family transcriptional regulator
MAISATSPKPRKTSPRSKRASTPEERPALPVDIPADATLAERAYRVIRQRIVTLEMPPGALIHEAEIMQDLGMSRTPVREALLRLSLERLVVMISRRGTFVADVNVGEVGRIFEFRRGLEAQAAEWAAQRRTDAHVVEIDALLAEMRGVPQHPSPSGTDARSQIPLDQRGHFLIYRMCGNHFAADVLEAHFFLSARMWFLAAGHITMDEPFDLLIALFEAIKAGDAAESRRLAVEHSEHAERSLREAL